MAGLWQTPTQFIKKTLKATANSTKPTERRPRADQGSLQHISSHLAILKEEASNGRAALDDLMGPATAFASQGLLISKQLSTNK